MKVLYNYISLVGLGNFNPAIVTPHFINIECALALGEPTQVSPPQMTVLKQLIFENIEFIIDLERLNIKEIKVSDTLEPMVLNIFETFYQKLPYTPLQAAGININCNIHPENDAELQSIQLKISDPAKYLDFFQANRVNVTEKSSFMKEEKTWITSAFVLEDIQGLSRRIDGARQEDFFVLNYNSEAGNLEKSKSKREMLLRKLLGEYGNFRDEFLRFINHLGDQ